MTLNEVLKNTNYDVSLFSEEARKYVEDGLLFFFRDSQAGNVIIALQLIPKTVLLVINVLFHYVILRDFIFAHMSQFPDYHILLYRVTSFSSLDFSLMRLRGKHKQK